MSRRCTLAYIVSHTLHNSHVEAIRLIRQGLVYVDEALVTDPRYTIHKTQTVTVQGKIIQHGLRYDYVIFYKPCLAEVTTSTKIPDNIYTYLPFKYHHLKPVGRLDKNSEGLLLLTNDGDFIHHYTHPDHHIAKVYNVETYRAIDAHLLEGFREPFLLGKRYTRPAEVEQLGAFSMRITLTEGINRHIRRICAKHQNRVKRLVRIAHGEYTLDDLQPGECRVTQRK